MNARLSIRALAALWCVAFVVPGAAKAGPSEPIHPLLIPTVTPTPSPSPGLPMLRLGNGAQLSGLKGLADSTALSFGTKTTTVGSLRSALAQWALAKHGSLVRFHAAPSTIVSPKSMPVTILLGKSSTPARTLRDTITVGPDPNYCKTHPPYILSAKGKITPGGYVDIEGVCFGSSGQLRLQGTFPGGALTLAVQHWDDGSIFAAIPDGITGVYDQSVTLQASSGAQYSNQVPANFIATVVAQSLPVRFVRLLQCNTSKGPSTCSGSSGSHLNISSGSAISDTDFYLATPPAPWHVTEIDYFASPGTMSPTMAGYSDGEHLYMNWTTAVTTSGTMTESCGPFSGLIGCDYQGTEPLQSAAYSFNVIVEGPAGTMPP